MVRHFGSGAGTFLLLLVVLASAGCGDKGEGQKSEGGLSKVDFGLFTLALPDGVDRVEEGKAVEGKEGDAYWAFSFPSGGSLVVYAADGRTAGGLQEAADLLLVAGEALEGTRLESETRIESYDRVQAGGGKGLLLSGTWTGSGRQGDLRCLAVTCAPRAFIVEAFHPSEWDKVLHEALTSFTCAE